LRTKKTKSQPAGSNRKTEEQKKKLGRTIATSTVWVSVEEERKRLRDSTLSEKKNVPLSKGDIQSPNYSKKYKDSSPMKRK